jgi:asparagine synthase (glutamine-hydrolysing)
MTLSYRFKSGLDEGDYAASVASLYNTKHVELFERDFDVAESMLDMAQIYDEPFADSSNIPTYQICKEARKHCKVVLTGDGADELFGGYSWKYRPLYHQVSGRNSTKLENLAYFLVLKVFHKFNKNLGTLYQAIGRRNLYLNRSLPESIDDLYWFFSEPEIKALGLPSWMEEDPENRFSDRFTDLNQALKHDMMDYMAGDILVKIDRASMKAGVELRAPFLDKELAEYVASLPSRLKLDSQRDKIILREAFSASWPEKIKRRTKQGFGSPVERWLSSDSMTEVKSHYLSRGRRICDHLNPDVVESFKQGSCMRTWAMLNFSIWCETWDI